MTRVQLVDGYHLTAHDRRGVRAACELARCYPRLASSPRRQWRAFPVPGSDGATHVVEVVALDRIVQRLSGRSDFDRSRARVRVLS